MRALVEAEASLAEDEVWFLEHPPVFTLGQAGRREHLLNPGDIPVVASDRGGQVTYHGPGQLVVYLLVDMRRRALGVKRLVHGLEQAVIDLLASRGLEGARRPGAPGVYVEQKKLAAIGLRIRNGRSYHGLAINVSNDLEPFTRIDPCGYAGLEVTRLQDFGLSWSVADTASRLLPGLAALLGCPLEAIRVDGQPLPEVVEERSRPGVRDGVAGGRG